MSLSSRQQAILEFIDQFLEQNGYPPSIRDIGTAVAISSTSVTSSLNRCPVTCTRFREDVTEAGLAHKVCIPEDGEILAI